MIDVARHIKLGKATGGAIRPEHFIFGCPELFCHFQYLFNGIMNDLYSTKVFVKAYTFAHIKVKTKTKTKCRGYCKTKV